MNLVSEGMEDLANASSAPFAAGVDEADALHIPLEPSEVVPVPRVADSAASIECRLHSSLNLGNSHLVVGEVRAITVREDTLEDGRPTMAALRPLSRLGRDEWGRPAGGHAPHPVHTALISCAAGSSRTSRGSDRRRPSP